MKKEIIKPIKLEIGLLIRFDESELPPSPLKSKSLFSHRLQMAIKELDLPNGFYAVALTYTAPTNKKRTRVTKKVKRYLLARHNDFLGNGSINFLSPYPRNLDFPPLNKWEDGRI